MADYPETYPFPSNVHIASSVTLKLSNSNYRLWKTQVESLLSSQKLLGFVNGKYPAPPATITKEDQTVPNPAHEAWFCSDQLVRSWIFGTLSEEALGSVCSRETSQEIWLALAKSYNRSSIGREFDLKRKLHLVTKQGKSFSDYVKEYSSVCDQLSSIGKPVEESIKICGFLIGLGREYDPITAVIQNSMSRDPAPSFSEILYEVEGFDARLQSYEVSTVSPQLVFNAASQPQQQNSNPQYYNNNNRGRGSYGYRGSFNRGRGGYTSRGRGFPQQTVSIY